MPDIAVQMSAILGTCLAGVAGLIALQTPAKDDQQSRFLPCPHREPSKRAYEVFVAQYTPVWMGAMAVIVALQLYEDFSPHMYIYVCGGLALPFVLQPILWPLGPDAQRPLLQRYAFKANLWLAVYSFIGNYWYTHYFYSVLQAAYTMPNAIRLNNVPIAMFLATHFYFSTYHMFSNLLLRKVVTAYQPHPLRTFLFASVVGVFAYFTAFMETLTIAAYPYWTFADRSMAYTVGSAFYGIYFLVSFPAFYFFDAHIDAANASKSYGVWDTIVSSCGYGMMILCLLDFVRLLLNVPLVVGADPI